MCDEKFTEFEGAGRDVFSLGSGYEPRQLQSHSCRATPRERDDFVIVRECLDVVLTEGPSATLLASTQKRLATAGLGLGIDGLETERLEDEEWIVD